MKKFFFLIIILLLNPSCTKLTLRREISIKDKNAKEFYEYFDNWKLKDAEQKLSDLNINETKKEILRQKIVLRRENKIKYEQLLSEIKNALNANNFQTLEKYISSSLINKIKIRELKKNDYSKVKIYFGKKEFYKKQASTLMLINYFEETFYIDLKFELKEKKEWELVSFKERR